MCIRDSYEAKLKIARRAAELIADGDTLMIENGSCCALLAVELAAQKRELTIITNSAFIANYIRGKADLQVVLLGGDVYKRQHLHNAPYEKHHSSERYAHMIKRPEHSKAALFRQGELTGEQGNQ